MKKKKMQKLARLQQHTAKTAVSVALSTKAATIHAALVRKWCQSTAETQLSIFFLRDTTNLYAPLQTIIVSVPELNLNGTFYLWNKTETETKSISFRNPDTKEVLVTSKNCQNISKQSLKRNGCLLNLEKSAIDFCKWDYVSKTHSRTEPHWNSCSCLFGMYSW